MKKLLSILALLLVLTASVSAPVLADEVRGTELQLIVTETPAPTVTPAPTPSEKSEPPESPPTENPAKTEIRNPITGNPMTLKEIRAAGMAVTALILAACMAAAPHQKKIRVK